MSIARTILALHGHSIQTTVQLAIHDVSTKVAAATVVEVKSVEVGEQAHGGEAQRSNHHVRSAMRPTAKSAPIANPSLVLNIISHQCGNGGFVIALSAAPDHAIVATSIASITHIFLNFGQCPDATVSISRMVMPLSGIKSIARTAEWTVGGSGWCR